MVQTIYDIIKAHGGEIKVESEESGGTVCIVHLPVQIQQIQQIP
jgi:signal transduction histidine kinase